MNPVEWPLELELKREARQRELLTMYEEEDWQGLLSAAELLNMALTQQLSINKWLAHEAADNLRMAWDAQRNHGQDD